MKQSAVVTLEASDSVTAATLLNWMFLRQGCSLRSQPIVGFNCELEAPVRQMAI